MPERYARVVIAREFGCLPWELDEAPMDGYQELVEWLSLEAQLSAKHPVKGAQHG